MMQPFNIRVNSSDLTQSSPQRSGENSDGFNVDQHALQHARSVVPFAASTTVGTQAVWHPHTTLPDPWASQTDAGFGYSDIPSGNILNNTEVPLSNLEPDGMFYNSVIEQHVTGFEQNADPSASLLDPYELPVPIQEAISEQLKIADPQNENALSEIADNILLDFGIYVSVDDVKRRLEQDRLAVDVLLDFANLQGDSAFTTAQTSADFTDSNLAADAGHALNIQNSGDSIARTGRAMPRIKAPHKVPDPDNPGKMVLWKTLQTRIRLSQMVADPDNPGKTIQKRALIHRQNAAKRIIDPENPAQTISADTLRTRKRGRKLLDSPFDADKQITYNQMEYKVRSLKEVPDPEKPGEMVSLATLQNREQQRKLIIDPDNEGSIIRASALNTRRYRENVSREKLFMEDPQQPGTQILRASFLRREKRNALLIDPDRPGQIIRQYDLEERRKSSSEVEHPFKPGVMIKQSSYKSLINKEKLIPNPANPSELITRAEYYRQRDMEKIPDPDNEGEFVRRDTYKKRVRLQKKFEKEQALQNFPMYP